MKLPQLFLIVGISSTVVLIPPSAFPQTVEEQAPPAKPLLPDDGRSLRDTGAVNAQDLFNRHRTLADSHRKEKDLDAAIDAYQAALSVRPSDRHSRFWLATLYRWSHQPKKAEEAYRLILKDHPDDSDTKIGLAYVYRSQGRNAEAKELIEEIFLKHPHHYEAKKLYARILEGEGAINRAAEIYRTLVADRPDDALARSRYLSIRKRSRPTVQLDTKDGRTRVLEGRGDPISVTRVEYLTDGIGLKSGVPLSDQQALSAEFSHKDEKLTLLELDGKPINRTIYDFGTNTFLVGTLYRAMPSWILSGKIGATRYRDQARSVENTTIGRYELKAHYQDRHNEAEVRLLRGPLLGRSTAGELDFRIFRRTQGSLRYRRKIQKGLISIARLTLSDYSDDNRTYEISAGLRFQRDNANWGITIRKTSLQGRFLIKPQLNLEFIDVHTIRLDYGLQLKKAWHISAYAQYRFFEDGNEEQQMVIEGVYSFQTVPWLSAGIEEEIDHFNRDAPQYSTLSIRTRTTGYLRVHYLWGSHWQTDIRVKLTATDDEGDSFYGGHVAEAKIEYTHPFSVILGVRGKVERNALNDSRRKVVGYLLFIF